MTEKVYLIAGVLIALAVLILIFAHNHYSKVKKNLINRENESLERIRKLEEEAKQKIEMNEAESARKIERMENEFRRKRDEALSILRAREDVLNQRIEKFNQEEEIREDYTAKSDRDIAIDLHVKLERMMEKLNSFEIAEIKSDTQQLIGTVDYLSEKIDSINEQVDNLSDELDSMSDEIDNNIENLESSIISNISDYSNSLDEDDVKSAVEEALRSYDSYSLRSMISDAVSESIGSISDTISSGVTSSVEEAVERVISNSSDGSDY